jgi:hypothetical protein
MELSVTTTSLRAGFYLRWILANGCAEFLANGCAEFLGLGTTLGLGAWLARTRPSLDTSPASALVTALGAILAGTFLEGALLGTCQAWVLKRALPAFEALRWIRATALGAALAWTLGMIPSTLMSIRAAAHPQPATATPAEPGLGLTLLLAAGMGAVLGPFLGIPQGRIIRVHGMGVGRWVIANSSAWALGRPVIFLATALVNETSSAASVGLALGGATLLAGLVVGAVHGRFLLPLVQGKP